MSRSSLLSELEIAFDANRVLHELRRGDDQRNARADARIKELTTQVQRVLAVETRNRELNEVIHNLGNTIAVMSQNMVAAKNR
jgi:hypothetical protein